MRILFDLYTPQCFVGGAGEYIRKVFYTLLEAIREQSLDVEVVALVDSSFAGGRFAYPDLSPEHLRTLSVEVADVSGRTLLQVLSEHRIDKVFVGAAQYWGGAFDVESLTCPVVCVVHDLCNEEFAVSNVEWALYLDSLPRLLKTRLVAFLRQLRHPRSGVKRMLPIMRMARQNRAFQLVTVSHYSSSSLAFHFDYPQERVKVLFSPARVSHADEAIANPTLQALVREGKKYYLMLSANRVPKNARKALRAFQRFAQTEAGRDACFVTVGYPTSQFPNHVVLPYLSESDLAQAMRHCYALLFPSIFEGFGYPPVEAMSYGKPVLAANVTSIPEVLGDAAIYFSPFYESDIFRALHALTDANYETYVQKSLARSAEVAARQQADLDTLVRLLVTN